MNRYKLVYADGSHEFVDAEGSTQAVAARKWGLQSEMPHTITDLSAIARFTGRRGYASLAPEPEPEYTQPLTWLERMRS
jgi:hypothetical protein